MKGHRKSGVISIKHSRDIIQWNNVYLILCILTQNLNIKRTQHSDSNSHWTLGSKFHNLKTLEQHNGSQHFGTGSRNSWTNENHYCLFTWCAFTASSAQCKSLLFVYLVCLHSILSTMLWIASEYWLECESNCHPWRDWTGSVVVIMVLYCNTSCLHSQYWLECESNCHPWRDWTGGDNGVVLQHLLLTTTSSVHSQMNS